MLERITISRALLDDLLVEVARGHLTPAMGDALNGLLQDGDEVVEPEVEARRLIRAEATGIVRNGLELEWPLHTAAQETAKRVHQEAQVDGIVENIALAERLRYLVAATVGLRDLESRPDIVTSIVGWALDQVDWLELADTYLRET